MNPKPLATDFWSKDPDYLQLLKTLAMVGLGANSEDYHE